MNDRDQRLAMPVNPQDIEAIREWYAERIAKGQGNPTENSYVGTLLAFEQQVHAHGWCGNEECCDEGPTYQDGRKIRAGEATRQAFAEALKMVAGATSHRFRSCEQTGSCPTCLLLIALEAKSQGQAPAEGDDE